MHNGYIIICMKKYGINNTPREVMFLIATKIKAIRKGKNITQKQLSVQSGVAYASVKKFETTGIISFESLLMLCNALGRLNEFDSILNFNDLEDAQNLFDI